MLDQIKSRCSFFFFPLNPSVFLNNRVALRELTLNHRGVKLEGTSGGPTPVLAESSRAYEELQGGDSTASLDNLSVPVFQHLNTELLPDLQEESPVSQFVPIVTCSGTLQHWKEPNSVMCALSLQVFIEIDEISLWIGNKFRESFIKDNMIFS